VLSKIENLLAGDIRLRQSRMKRNAQAARRRPGAESVFDPGILKKLLEGNFAISQGTFERAGQNLEKTLGNAPRLFRNCGSRAPGQMHRRRAASDCPKSRTHCCLNS